MATEPKPKALAPVDVWPALQERARGRTADHAALEALSLVGCAHGVITLRLVDPGARALVRGRTAWIREQASSLMGEPVAISIDGIEDERADARDDDPAASHRAMQDPVVRKAAELFDARVAGVRTVRDTGATGQGER